MTIKGEQRWPALPTAVAASAASDLRDGKEGEVATPHDRTESPDWKQPKPEPQPDVQDAEVVEDQTFQDGVDVSAPAMATSPAAGVAPPGDDPAGTDAASRPDAQESVQAVPPGTRLVPVHLDPWGRRPFSPWSRSVAP